MKIRILSLVVLSIMLASCASPTPIINTVEVTRISIQTVVVTEIVERVITTTPEPPTQTPEPSSTPEVTPTPIYALWTVDQVVQEFEDAGLKVGEYYPMTVDDFGLAPYVATDAVRFMIPTICADCGGRIFAFDDPEKLAVTKEYYDKLGEQSAYFFSWTFTKDNILVQINGDLPEEKAKQYQAALDQLD